MHPPILLKRSHLLISGVLLLHITIWAQETHPGCVTRRVADYILKENAYGFVNSKTGRVYPSTENLKSTENLDFLSQYNGWKYSHGVLNMAMLDLFEFTGDARYKEYVLRNYQFAFDNADFFRKNYTGNRNKWNYPYGQMFIIEELDDCGAIGAGLIEAYLLEPQTRYLQHIERSAGHIMDKQLRLQDGTLARPRPQKNTVWGDDLYMSVPFLARMGNLTGDMKYIDEAVRQVLLFHKHLYDAKTGLYYHNWFSDVKENGVAHWGRCNGWIIMAKVNLLDHLPEGHPQRDTLIGLLREQIVGLSRYQDKTGLWHQILNRYDSYLESSCTAMFTYSIAKAVNEGWIDDRYSAVAEDGWAGLTTKIQPDGQVESICMGTGVANNIKFYYERPAKLNDFHGLGPVILAGTEMLRLESETLEE